MGRRVFRKKENYFERLLYEEKLKAAQEEAEQALERAREKQRVLQLQQHAFSQVGVSMAESMTFSMQKMNERISQLQSPALGLRDAIKQAQMAALYGGPTDRLGPLLHPAPPREPGVIDARSLPPHTTVHAGDIMNDTNESKRVLAMSRTQKPAVTRDDYERGRAVLDALPPGIYLKCTGCKTWQTGGDITFDSNGVYCEKCAK